ncbi:MAG TPA: hypothetical protein [Caudoviricetes sp.]|nr:MAG TPA: hypothetical protein [Caudoviricetes sp.]
MVLIMSIWKLEFLLRKKLSIPNSAEALLLILGLLKENQREFL